MKFIIAVMTMLFMISCCYSQERKETILKEVSFSSTQNHTLWIDNINGNIKAEGYSGSTVIIEVNEEIKAKTQSDLDKFWNKVKIIIPEYEQRERWLKENNYQLSL